MRKRLLLALFALGVIFTAGNASAANSKNCAKVGDSQHCTFTFDTDGSLTADLFIGGRHLRDISATCEGTWGGGTITPYVTLGSGTPDTLDVGGVAQTFTADDTLSLANSLTPFDVLTFTLSGSVAADLTCWITME